MSASTRRSSAAGRWLALSILVFMGLGGCQASTTPTVYFSGLSDSVVRANAPSYTGVSRTRFTASPAGAALMSSSPAPVSGVTSPAPTSTSTGTVVPTTSPAPTSTGTSSVTPTPVPTPEALVGGAGTPHLHVSLEAAPPTPAAEPFVVVVHLRNEEGLDKAVAYGHWTGGATSSWLPSGFAAVVNLTTRTVEELSPMVVSGRDISAALTPSLLDGYRILTTASYWLPSTVDPVTVAGGLFGNLAHSTMEASTRDEQIFTPNLDAFLLVAAPAVPRFPSVTCPPRPTDKVTEVDLDGRPNTEKDKEVVYDESVTDMGDGNLSVIVGFIRPNPANPDGAPDGGSSCFLLLIIKDKDGDGKADPEEIADARTSKAAGMCVYPRGRNSVDRIGNKIVWICLDYDQDGNPTGKAKIFIYDLGTGELKVYEMSPGSTTPSETTPFFPAPY